MPTEAALDTLSQRLDKLYEFEREPVSPGQLQSGRYFAACFAGEHIAATEFVIGAMFAKHGVAARDLLLGLLIGNFLAVLSWAFLCAPIAVRVRLTLYWYLRRIAGPGLTVIYNVVNGILFCILAGAMIAVSSSAVSLGINEAASSMKLGFHIRHPQLTDVLPNSVGWVVIVLVVGAVVVSLAIMGFKRLSQFSAVCAPWMFIIFITGAIATLPRLGDIHDLDGLWDVAQTKIWNGVPLAGQDKLGFWHITFFAWFCNLATHVGLSDMALFRYAKKWTYGFYSAIGMYIGHYISWICAGVMGATVAGLNPGQMSVMAAGVAGPLAVVLAGWTTANPTMYRAGLALQIATPNWARWKVTLAAGVLTTLLACFPVFFVRLLDFVAIYGLVLMPVGAIVVAEHWLLPRLGLRQYWAERTGVKINIPAALTWVIVLLVTFPSESMTLGHLRSPMDLLGMHLFFRWLPGWFLSVMLYIGLCYLVPAARAAGAETVRESKPGRSRASSPPANPPAPAKQWLLGTMIAGAVALLALAVCVALSLKVFIGGADPAVYAANLAGYKRGLLIATIVYFVCAIVWQSRRERVRG